MNIDLKTKIKAQKILANHINEYGDVVDLFYTHPDVWKELRNLITVGFKHVPSLIEECGYTYIDARKGALTTPQLAEIFTKAADEDGIIVHGDLSEKVRDAIEKKVGVRVYHPDGSEKRRRDCPPERRVEFVSMLTEGKFLYISGHNDLARLNIKLKHATTGEIDEKTKKPFIDYYGLVDANLYLMVCAQQNRLGGNIGEFINNNTNYAWATTREFRSFAAVNNFIWSCADEKGCVNHIKDSENEKKLEFVRSYLYRHIDELSFEVPEEIAKRQSRKLVDLYIEHMLPHDGRKPYLTDDKKTIEAEYTSLEAVNNKLKEVAEANNNCLDSLPENDRVRIKMWLYYNLETVKKAYPHFTLPEKVENTDSLLMLQHYVEQCTPHRFKQPFLAFEMKFLRFTDVNNAIAAHAEGNNGCADSIRGTEDARGIAHFLRSHSYALPFYVPETSDEIGYRFILDKYIERCTPHWLSYTFEPVDYLEYLEKEIVNEITNGKSLKEQLNENPILRNRIQYARNNFPNGAFTSSLSVLQKIKIPKLQLALLDKKDIRVLDMYTFDYNATEDDKKLKELFNIHCPKKEGKRILTGLYKPEKKDLMNLVTKRCMQLDMPIPQFVSLFGVSYPAGKGRSRLKHIRVYKPAIVEPKKFMLVPDSAIKKGSKEETPEKTRIAEEAKKR